jgi:hypothetical protein
VKRKLSRSYVLAALLVSVSLNLGTNFTAGAATWQGHLTGRLLGHHKSSLPFDTAVLRSHLLVGWMDSKDYQGKFSYALADIGVYEYPVSTVDHGRQWRIAGNYFNLDDTSGMGAGGSPSNIVTLSHSIAVAFRRGDIVGPVTTIYVTVDSGRQWYMTFVPGAVESIKTVIRGRNDSVLKSQVASVRATTIGGNRKYTTLDGGRNWILN